MKNNIIATLGGLAIISVVSTLSLSSVFATDNTDAVDSISIGVPISCSMEGTGMTSHNATINNGTYQADIGSTTLKAYCNDDEGFAIFAAGYTGDEIGGTNSTKLIGTNGNIVTGTATSGNTSNWAMKLATNSGATYPITLDNSFGAYSAVPVSYTKVAHRDSGTDIGTGATGASLTTTYAAFVSQTQPAGTYSGKVKYTLVHPSNEVPAQPIACDAGKICYNPNTTTVAGEMGKQTASNNASVVLWAPNFKRAGYGFAGWNTAYDYSGATYGPNETITTPSDVETNGLSLYAVWVPSAGTLQNWNGCSGLTQGTVTALTDNRDNDTYAVAKLADNKCWMIENLRLADKDSSNNDINLSNTNTHNPSIPLNNSWYYRNQQGTLTTSNHLSVTSDPSSTNPNTAWCLTVSSNCMDQSMLAANNTIFYINNTSSDYSASGDVYSYGNYFNWYSATAGHGKYADGSGYTALGDICPAGWRLPIGKDTTGDFGILDIALGSTGAASAPSTIPTGATMSLAYRIYPNNFVYSGSVHGAQVNDRNSNGEYWSASGLSNLDAYYASFDSAYVYPGVWWDSKYEGRTVRCVIGN